METVFCKQKKNVIQTELFKVLNANSSARKYKLRMLVKEKPANQLFKTAIFWEIPT